MDARGIKAEMVAEGAHRSSMAELTSWTEAASKVLVFCRQPLPEPPGVVAGGKRTRPNGK